MRGLDGIHNEVGLHLGYFSADRADLVTMTCIVIAGLIDRRTVKTVADDKTQLQKQVQRIIKRSAAYREFVVPDELVTQVFEREVSFCIVDGLENGVALRCLAMIVHLKIAVEYLQHILPNVYFYHKPHKGTTFWGDKSDIIYKKSKLARFNALLASLS